MAKTPLEIDENAPPRRMTWDGGRQRPMTPEERAEYEGWEKDWQERFGNPEAWERERYKELRAARLVREAQEAECNAAWAACVHRPPWKRDCFSLDEIAKNVRVPGQVGSDDAAGDRMLVDLFSSVLAHYFDGSVLTWSTGPPHLITFDPENARWVQELDHDVDGAAIRKLGFAGLLFLTRAALKRWCEHNGFVLPPEWISADPDLSIGLTDQPDQEHGAAITLVAQDEKTEPQRRARGPKKGSGKYAHPDRGLFPVIKKMHDSGMPLYGAVSEISDRISGNSQRESLIRRVERRYRQEVLGKK